MSVYWYAICEKHMVTCDAGDSHASGNFNFDEKLGRFIPEHSGCGVKFIADPDCDSHPEFFDCEEFER